MLIKRNLPEVCRTLGAGVGGLGMGEAIGEMVTCLFCLFTNRLAPTFLLVLRFSVVSSLSTG